jgi:hypothetical protein
MVLVISLFTRNGVLRMEAGFEIILCDFKRDLIPVRITQVKRSSEEHVYFHHHLCLEHNRNGTCHQPLYEDRPGRHVCGYPWRPGRSS